MKNIVEYLKYYAEHTPNKTAIISGDEYFSYSAVWSKVKALATAITDLHLVNKPIIVKVERNAETIFSFFGVLASGNYYVPVDSCITQEKFKSIIETSGAKHVFFASQSSQGENEGCSGIKTLDFASLVNAEINNKQFSAEFDNKFVLPCDENAPIYLIYTSGSTGEPKGVLKTHKNMLSFVDNFIATFGMDSREVIANQAPFSFDASAKDIYLALRVGATLVIPPKQLFLFPTKLIEYLNANKVTFICWVPSALTLIVRTKALTFVKPTTLKRIFFVGEVFQPKYLNVFLKELPDVEYYNLYGSTEIAGVCAYYKIGTQKLLAEDRAIPIGIALKNNIVYLDDGEICVISEQFALGYVNDAEKNAKVFTLNDQGQRVLRTGDFATYDEYGNLVFISRKDFQIKHMGYRIELQEIELAITALTYVSSSACVYDNVHEKIIAFVVLNEALADGIKILLTDIKAKLQLYMVPNKIVLLDDMPLNTNGKTDRQKLMIEIERE